MKVVKENYLKENNKNAFICGIPIKGTTLFNGNEFDDWMNKVIKEAEKDE